jgi:hypothetical protein
MIDLHAHILPGLDDCARTIEEARDLARRGALVQITAASPDVRAAGLAAAAVGAGEAVPEPPHSRRRRRLLGF